MSVRSSDADSSYSYSYDLQGRAVSISNSGTTGSPTVVLDATFLADGLRSALAATVNSAADFSNAYSYDALGRLSDIQQAGANTAEKRIVLAYDALDRYTTITRYSNVAGTQLVATSAYGYYADERLLSMTHTGQSARAYTFAWDAGERLTKMTLPTDDSTYGYDRSNQLTSADHAAQTDEGYTYDANGNRLAYTTGAENRLTSDGTYTYTHDDEGNRTRKSQTGEVWDYEWDHRNRLTKVTLRATVGGAIQKEFLYTYDLTDRRLGKSVDNDGPGGNAPVLTRFVYDGLHIALASTGTTQLTSRYLHGAAVDQVLADEQISSGTGPGTVYWPTTDHLGTVRELLDNSGVVAKQIGYDAYGKITSDTAPTLLQLFGYTGREWEETLQLWFYRLRWYDAQTQRFLSEDPILQDRNLFRYVGNQPTFAVDPSGLRTYFVLRPGGGAASPVHVPDNVQDPLAFIRKLYGQNVIVHGINDKGAVDAHLGINKDPRLRPYLENLAPSTTGIPRLRFDLAADNAGGPSDRVRLSNLGEVADYIEKELRQIKRDCVQHVQIGSHGGPGFLSRIEGSEAGLAQVFLSAGFTGDARRFLRDERNASPSQKEAYEALQALRRIDGKICQGGKIEFVACSVCPADDAIGKAFKKELESVFVGKEVILHGHGVVWGRKGDAVQSGTGWFAGLADEISEFFRVNPNKK